MNPFTRRPKASGLNADEAARQGHVARLAIDVLGPVDAKLFLNSFDESLGGRPIELAVRSRDGLAAVESLLATRRQP